MSEPMHDTSLGLTGRSALRQERETLRAGKDALAFAVTQPDGTVNVHILRPGRPPLAVFGATVLPLRTSDT